MEPTAAEIEEVDIDLEDPDVEKAAVKIQAGFKGMKARQQVREMKVSINLLLNNYKLCAVINAYFTCEFHPV